jgi:hypothetical protein
MNNEVTADIFFLDSYFGESISKEDKQLWLECNNQAKESINIMIEFAKLHVKLALKEASNKATTKDWNEDGRFDDEDGEHFEYLVINRDSILNAYPLENIK